MDAKALRPGMTIAGRYLIERPIGRGGFGAVFAAKHLGTGGDVALKVLADAQEASDNDVQRFLLEAKVTAGLRHPNTVRVFDFGRDDSGTLYMVMELLRGVSLRQELERRMAEGGVFSEREAVQVAVAVTKSLSEAHAVNLVHRDLKPDNIFLQEVPGDEPVVKVLDFGIVKLTDVNLTLGTSERMPGTPAFMSPEQVVGMKLDLRSDLYALGIMLYLLVTGTVPFRGDNAVETLAQHVRDPLPDLRARARTPLSPRFVHVVETALAKDRELRFASALRMREALEACLQLPPPAPAPLLAPTEQLPAADPTPPPRVAPARPTAPPVAAAVHEASAFPLGQPLFARDLALAALGGAVLGLLVLALIHGLR